MLNRNAKTIAQIRLPVIIFARKEHTKARISREFLLVIFALEATVTKVPPKKRTAVSVFNSPNALISTVLTQSPVITDSPLHFRRLLAMWITMLLRT